MNQSQNSFHAARDLLLRLHGDPEAAYTQFRWPRPQHFNWALDHFDVMANGNWDAQWDRLSWLYSLGAHLAEECERHLANPGGAA